MTVSEKDDYVLTHYILPACAILILLVCGLSYLVCKLLVWLL